MICFSNPGEIDPRLITTLGINVKDDPSAIGYFGTGLKYAIAILLRNNCQITIWSGQTKYSFSTQTETIRGKEFSFIYMNGERLGFTTELGKNWEPWMAYRELRCNALDEGGKIWEQPDSLLVCPVGETLITVTGALLDQIHQERHLYFISTTPLYNGEECQIHPANNDCESSLFYRGIRAASSNGLAAFRYNILSTIRLTEDRTIENCFASHLPIIRTIGKIQDPALIEKILLRPKPSFESNLDFAWGLQDTSEEFQTVVRHLIKTQIANMNYSAVKWFYAKHPAEKTFEKIDLSELKRKMLERAIHFVTKMNFAPTHEIICVHTLGKHVLACAENGQIVLADAAFSGGTKTLVKALIEEETHLRYGVEDRSREMQNIYLDKIVDLAEELSGEPL